MRQKRSSSKLGFLHKKRDKTLTDNISINISTNIYNNNLFKDKKTINKEKKTWYN